MEIRNNKTSVYIENLRAGEVFTFRDVEEYGYDPYLRINDVQDEDGNILLAVNLEDGFPICCKYNEQVIPCRAYLTIE